MSQIKLDIEDKEKSGYDDSNALVLPSEKRSAKLKQETDAPTVKKLSKKERKRLEKIIEQKEKKNKASIIKALYIYISINKVPVIYFKEMYQFSY